MATSKSTFQKRQKEMKRQENSARKRNAAHRKNWSAASDADFPMEPLTGPLVDPEFFPETDDEN